MNRIASLLFAVVVPASLVASARAAPAREVARQESAATLIEQGRALLAAGRPAEAQAAFDAAAALDASPRTRTWVVRGWIALAKYDEALQGADELKQAAPRDADYLFGLAFFGLAKQSLGAGGSAYTASQFEDALASLERATAADAERYRDAWLPLAEAAWYAQALDKGRAAARRAIALEPARPEAQVMLGRIEFSSYVASEDAAAKDEAWKAAAAAFDKAIELYGTPSGAWQRNALSDVHVQRGTLSIWKQDNGAAAASFALAIGLDPSRVPFDKLREWLAAEGFAACLADGLARFKQLHSESEPMYATLSWWNGFSLFESAKWPEAEAAFRRAVELWPPYTNSWYYVFRALYSQQKYPEAIEALRAHMRASPEGLASALGGAVGTNLAAIDYLVGWCVNPEKQPRGLRNGDAAFLCEVLTRVQPTESRHWNNLGLFVRDEGDALRARLGKSADPEVLAELWGRALAAYEKSLELEPDNPNFINDTAVMYHYYLKRDFDKARSMYERAARRADEELARKDLPAEVRAVVEIARRDSNDNIRRLGKYLDKRAAGEDIDPGDVR